MSSPHSIDSTGRIVAIDAARGMAMMFACLSHFAWWLEGTYTQLAYQVASVGMVATPAFILLSGAMVGLRFERAQGMPRPLRVHLIDRGLFLITIAHFLIGLAEVHRGGDLRHRMIQLNTVDTIGVGCILAAAVGERILRRPKLVVGVGSALLLGAWFVAASWHPRAVLADAVTEILVGRTGDQRLIGYDCPLVQFLSLFLIGAVMGRAFESHARAGTLGVIGRRALRVGAALMVAAVGLRLGWVLLARHFGSASVLRETLTIVKQPPSPGYLLFFGGAALVLIATPMLLTRGRRWFAVLEWVAGLGRASLFVFVLQYFVLWTLPDLLGIRPNALAPAVFVVEVSLLWLLARLWTALRGNRWLAIGLRDDNALT